ncbi:hypothetical protein K443DRAFT_470539 [Laccaria amethystina LaAM-08-1]|uniref:Uncharacterized protein n=1 Tax=Laccaria amethystina LaAM-08-1 TaxID=1095629 RepID=A0A0C9WHU1_9AGAR|nr:hypothetical protein K443DRAFT_470539 [Laccaria amethystina LaAM-08-1]
MAHQRIFTLPSFFHTTQNASHPGSMFVPSHSICFSKPLPLTLSSFPPAGKQQSKRSFIPNYPPRSILMLIRSSLSSSSIIFSSSSDVSHLFSPFPTPLPPSTPVHSAPQPQPRPHLADRIHA